MIGCTFLCTFISLILPVFLAVDEISRCLKDFLYRVKTMEINAMSKRLVSYWEKTTPRVQNYFLKFNPINALLLLSNLLKVIAQTDSFHLNLFVRYYDGEWFIATR